MTAAQNRALTALLQCKTREEAARMAGISSRTLRTYFQNADFVAAYRAAAAEMLQDAVMEARQGVSPALSTLREIAENGEEAAPARVSASKASLEYFLRLHDAADVEDRIAALEAQIGGLGKQ